MMDEDAAAAAAAGRDRRPIETGVSGRTRSRLGAGGVSAASRGGKTGSGLHSGCYSRDIGTQQGPRAQARAPGLQLEAAVE